METETENSKIKKFDRKILTIVLLSLIILGIAGVYAYNQLEKKFYNLGVQDTTLLINQQIISNVVQNGGLIVFVPLNTTEGEQIYQVKLGIVNSTRIK